jgi:hypothetical protein
VSTPTGPLDSAVVHTSVQTSLVATGLTPGALHFNPVHLSDVDIAGIIVFANIGFGRVRRHRPFEEIFAPENIIENKQ